MKKQEETRQVELQTKAAEFKAMQAQAETVCLTKSLRLITLIIPSLYPLDNVELLSILP